MSKGVITIEFLLCLLGALLIISAFIDIALTLKEKLEKTPIINKKISRIIEQNYKENNWIRNERPNNNN